MPPKHIKLVNSDYNISTLEKIVESLNTATQEAGVPIITGIGCASDIIRDLGFGEELSKKKYAGCNLCNGCNHRIHWSLRLN